MDIGFGSGGAGSGFGSGTGTGFDIGFGSGFGSNAENSAGNGGAGSGALIIFESLLGAPPGLTTSVAVGGLAQGALSVRVQWTVSKQSHKCERRRRVGRRGGEGWVVRQWMWLHGWEAALQRQRGG